MSTRDIEAHLRELYGVLVGRDLISRVTDAVIEDVKAWQPRPLDDLYPVLFLDGFVLKIRDGGAVQRKACYLALASTMDGQREVLGMWFQQTEGAKFWMQVLTDLPVRRIPSLSGQPAPSVAPMSSEVRYFLSCSCSIGLFVGRVQYALSALDQARGLPLIG